MNGSLLSLSLGTTLTSVSSSQSESLQRSRCVVLKTSIEHLAVLPLPSRSMDNSCGAPHASASPLWHSSSSFSVSLFSLLQTPPHHDHTVFLSVSNKKTFQDLLAASKPTTRQFSHLFFFGYGYVFIFKFFYC